MYILLVDDDESIRSAFKDMLSAVTSEYELLVADDGHKAWSLLLKYGSQIKVIFCDGTMPEMDGPTFVKKVRGNTHFDNIPIVCISGNPKMQEEMSQAGTQFNPGTQLNLPKPFNLQQLETALKVVALLKIAP